MCGTTISVPYGQSVLLHSAFAKPGLRTRQVTARQPGQAPAVAVLERSLIHLETALDREQCFLGANMVKGLLAATLLFLYGNIELSAQTVTQADLPRLLAKKSGSQRVISFVAASRAERLPLLLDLANTTPPDVDEHDLYVGLADTFGALKATEAIPFLLRNIALRRDLFLDLAPWLKTAQVIEWSFPAAAALISIGPDASRAVMRAYDQAMKPEERLAAVFVVSRIRGVSEARVFLSRVIGRADLERYFAQEGVEDGRN